jgi:hypothetical protein
MILSLTELELKKYIKTILTIAVPAYCGDVVTIDDNARRYTPVFRGVNMDVSTCNYPAANVTAKLRS